MTTKRLHSSPGGEARHGAGASVDRLVRLHPLFVASAVIRGALALLLVLGAMYVLRLLGTSDLIAWLVLGLTSAGLAVVLLDDALDIEGKVADQAARAAVFEPDGFGVRAAAVREYCDDFVRIRGRIPRARTRIKQPGDNQLFRVYFPSRAADCRRWFATALLASLHSALRFAAAGLGLVISIQFYFLSGS
ncbi:MAG TPA: hypothetical protein VD791_06685 [Burkholderiales bacterium]|nr:hypothetical protein [Burkholderiales bacterium]